MGCCYSCQKVGNADVDPQPETHEYDAFISYQWGIKDDVEKFHNNLTSQNIKAWRDVTENGMKTDNESIFKQIANGIDKSKVFLCFLTKGYCKSDNCKSEINYAHKTKKRIIYLMIEKEDHIDNEMIFIMGNKLYTHCYKNPNNWWEANFEEIRKAIKLNFIVDADQEVEKIAEKYQKSTEIPELEVENGVDKSVTDAQIHYWRPIWNNYNQYSKIVELQKIPKPNLHNKDEEEIKQQQFDSFNKNDAPEYPKSAFYANDNQSQLTSNSERCIGYYVSRGSANGNEVYKGPRGGYYYLNGSNNKQYVKPDQISFI